MFSEKKESSKESNIIPIKTSMSSKGYTIYKSKFNENELEKIKNDLTIKPFTCPGYGNTEDVIPYKLYKENNEKIYVPYFYGRNNFGIPNISKLTERNTFYFI